MPYVLALDQGTTSSRAVLYDQTGAVVSTARRDLRQIYPQPGWVEHDADAIWAGQLDAAREAIDLARVDVSHIACIGITNQRETTVVWERDTGRPICNAIVWQDRRTAGACDALRAAGHEAMIRKATGLVIDPYFSATKIRWVLDHVAGVRDRALRGELCFGTVDSYLIHRLTNGRSHVTDVSNASRTMLLDLTSLNWDAGLMRLFEIPPQMMPRVTDSSGVVGVTDARWFGREIPITGVAGDQQAALFGQACVERGMAKNTYGTGCFTLMHVGVQPPAPTGRLLNTVAWRRAGRPVEYAVEGSVFAGGSVVQWLRDGLGIIASSTDIEPLALSVRDTGGVTFVPAFTGLGAPHWDPHARGLICGLTRGTTRAHLARAALEAIAFQVTDVIETMRGDTGVDLQRLRVDGGGSVNNLLLQIQADLLGVPIERPRDVETTARGAAYLAGLGAGVWNDVTDLDTEPQVDRVFEPSISREEARSRMDAWRRAVGRAMA